MNQLQYAGPMNPYQYQQPYPVIPAEALAEDGFISALIGPLKSHLHEHGIPFAGKLALHPGGVIAMSIVGGLAAAAAIVALCSFFAQLIKSLIKPGPGHVPLLLKPLILFGSAALKPILKPILAAAGSAGLKPGTPLTILKPAWAAAVAAAAAAPTALNAITKPAMAAAAAAAGIEPAVIVDAMKPAVLATNEIAPDPVTKPTSSIEVYAVKPVKVLKPMTISAQIETTIPKQARIDDSVDALIEQARAGSIQLVPLAGRIIDTINRFHDRYNL